MLVPFQTSGAKPALYLVHGLYGLMPMGRLFARSLGPDQPLYGINANGIDGRETVACDDAQSMVLAYVKEILDAQPSGPLLLGGMCAGGIIAIEVAHELQATGREVGPLILLDPPSVPGIYNRNRLIDPRNPAVASHLYQRVRAQLLNHDPRDIPFAINDEQRVHLATLAGVNALVALSQHRPKIFHGEATAILSSERAAAFFNPQMLWVKLLPQRPTAHVLSCSHAELFRSAQYNLARVLKFVLESVMHCRSRTERADGSIFASAS